MNGPERMHRRRPHAVRAGLAAVLLPLLVSACGFQLRGAAELPPDVERLYVNGSDAIREEVAIYLEGGETEIVDDRAAADVVLNMSNSRFGRRVLSVDPNTGKEREFELSYTIDIQAKRADGSELLPAQSITLLRDYVYDPAVLIGAGRQETVLRLEMRRDAVQQALYRLRLAVTG